MVAYDYRCGEHGEFEINVPLGSAMSTAPCCACGADSTRVYHAPLTSRAPAHLVAALDKAEKSRSEPEVVTSLPRRAPHRRTPTAPPNPAFRKLPRP